MLKWGPKHDCLASAYVRDGKNPVTGRKCKLHLCSMCDRLYAKKDMRADHIHPVVDPVEGFKNWDTYIERMFVEADMMQPICIHCHKEKTAEERALRLASKAVKSVRKRKPRSQSVRKRRRRI